MNNAEVVRAWMIGRRGRSLNMHTDGQTVYSYSLPVGITHEGDKLALLWTARGLSKVSVTTARHSNIVADVACRVIRTAVEFVNIMKRTPGEYLREHGQ